MAERTTPAAKHLLEVVFRTNISHEDKTLESFDIGTSSDHVNGHGYAWIEFVAECREYRLGVLFSVIGYLLAELVPAPEFFAHNVDDVVRMTVCFGKNESLGYFLAARNITVVTLSRNSRMSGTNRGTVDNIASSLPCRIPNPRRSAPIASHGKGGPSFQLDAR